MSMKMANVKIGFGDELAEEWRKEQEDKMINNLRNERMWELYKSYLQCTTYAGKQAFILEHGIVNKSKYFSMSKRRQKKFLDEEFGLYCDIKQDKLVPRYRRNQRWIVRIDPVFKFVEQTAKPFNNMMEAWMGCLLEEG